MLTNLNMLLLKNLCTILELFRYSSEIFKKRSTSGHVNEDSDLIDITLTLFQSSFYLDAQ